MQKGWVELIWRYSKMKMLVLKFLKKVKFVGLFRPHTLKTQQNLMVAYYVHIEYYNFSGNWRSWGGGGYLYGIKNSLDLRGLRSCPHYSVLHTSRTKGSGWFESLYYFGSLIESEFAFNRANVSYETALIMFDRKNVLLFLLKLQSSDC